MKKIMLTSVLSLGTLMSVNLPGLDYMTVHAASPSKINVTDSSYSQQVLLEKQYQKQTGTIIEKNEGQLTLSKGNLIIQVYVSDNVLKEVNVGDTVNVYAPDFGPSTMIDAPLIARDAIIQKTGEKNFLEKQYQKETGTVIEKNEDYLTLSNGNLTIQVYVSDNVLKEVNVGDTVNVYAPNFEPSMRINSIVQKIDNKGSISKVNEEKNEDFIMGTVVTSAKDYVTVEYKNAEGKSELVDIEFSKVHNYKQGDKVKVTNKGKWVHQKIGIHNITFASEDSISKVNAGKNEDFIMGTVVTSAKDYVTVEYKNAEGKSELVDIEFSKVHNYKQGDKVKVTNKGKWVHQKIGIHNITFASEDSISKVNAGKNEDFIMGTVVTSAKDYVTVEYKNTEGKSELVDIEFSKVHNYKQGDKVKVTNKGKWVHQKIGIHNITFASEDSISKVSEK